MQKALSLATCITVKIVKSDLGNSHLGTRKTRSQPVHKPTNWIEDKRYQESGGSGQCLCPLGLSRRFSLMCVSTRMIAAMSTVSTTAKKKIQVGCLQKWTAYSVYNRGSMLEIASCGVLQRVVTSTSFAKDQKIF